MNITFRQCEILLAAADAATFSAAAKGLGISQPSLSESIRRIERESGLTLFERTTRSLKLTDDGRRLAAVARDVLRDVRHALDQMTAGSGRLTIAALPSITCAALPRAFEEFARSHPGIEFVLHDVQHERAAAMVADRLADLAITIKPAAADGLVFESVVSDSAHLVCRRDHPLAKSKQVRWRDVAGFPFVGITAISSVRRLTDAAFVHGDIAVKPRYEVEQVPSAVALVEAGLGVTALPALTFAMFKGRDVAVRPLVDPVLRRNVGFLTRANRKLPAFAAPLMQAIADNLKRALTHAAPQRPRDT